MSEKTLEQELLEAAEMECKSYSGRGMCGDKCLAVVTNDDPLRLFANLVENLEPLRVEIATLAEMMRDAKTDSMGRGTVVYWPSLAFVGDDNETQESE